MRACPTLAIALPLALLVACSSPEERLEAAREAVAQALAQGDRTAAMEAIEELRGALPDTPEAQREIAQLLVAAGSAPEAGWLLEEAVRRHPDRNDLRLALARVALLLGNPSLAREVVAPVAPDADEHLPALLAQAQAELDLGDLEAALETLGEAQRLYPDRPEAQLARVSTLFSEHRTDEARAAAESLLASLEGEDEATAALRRRLRITLAQIQAQAGAPDEALALLEAAVAEAPSDVQAWRAWVQILARQERHEEALARLEEVLAGEDPPVALLPLAAQLYAALGHDDEAKALLRRLIADAGSAAAYLPLLELHWNRGEMDEASSLLESATARFPDEPQLRLLRAEDLLDRGRLDDARAEIRRFSAATFAGDPQIEYLDARLDLAEGDDASAARRLRKLAPRLDRAPTQFWLGRALEAGGDTEGARRRYELAQRRDPRWIAPPAALVSLESRRGDWRAVAAQARALVKQAPQRMEGWIALVGALENLGEGEAAEPVARQSLERFPDRSEPHILLAKALRVQGRTEEALAALDAIEEPDAAARAERILTLGMGGRVEEGVALARAALAAEPEAAQLHAALAALLYAAGAEKEGAQATDRALALAPQEPRPLRVRCQFRASRGHWRGARDDCTRYLEARPDDAGAHFMAGLSHQQLGETQPAIAAYRRAAILDERDARSRNNLADLLATEGDLDGALAAAQEAYRLDETDPYVMDTLGALYLRKGLASRAVSLLEEAHAAAPDLPDATLHLALAYRDSGRADEARRLLAELLASDAGSAAVRARAEEALDSLP